MSANDAERLATDRLVWLDTEVVELALLLPREDLLRLEHQALSRSLSLGQLIRHVLHDWVARQGCGESGGPAGPWTATVREEQAKSSGCKR